MPIDYEFPLLPKVFLFTNVTCIIISEKLCIGQLNINLLIFICMTTNTNLYFSTKRIENTV